MRPFCEQRADAVAECAAGFAYNLLSALVRMEPSAAWAELSEMFRNAIQAYCASGGEIAWPPSPSEN